MSDTRRFDSLERVVRDTRQRLDDTSGTVLARLGSHTHPGGGAGHTHPYAPIGLDSEESYVGTAQTTTSTVYVDLPTVGPTCVLTLASARRVLIILKGTLFQTGTANRVYMSVAATGATVAAAGDAAAVIHNGSGQAESYAGIVYLDCAAGTTTFTAKYRVLGGTGSFQDRFMVVIPV